MRRLAILVGVVILLIIGGSLTSRLETTGGTDFLPATIRQSDIPEASVFEAAPWQAEQFLLLVGFVLFNVVGMGVTIALVMWFLHRQLRDVARSDSEDEGEVEPGVA